MIRNPDHVSFVVQDLEAAKRFFSLLGFEETIATVISGPTFSRYMGLSDTEADHITMVLKDCSPHFDVQLLRYHHPEALSNPNIRELNNIGFNHLCLTVDDLDVEVDRLKAEGVKFRNEVIDYHDRRIIFLEGPEGITLELAQWATT